MSIRPRRINIKYIKYISTAGQNSRQQHRNVVGNKGTAIFKGRIRIPKVAQQTDSEQVGRRS